MRNPIIPIQQQLIKLPGAKTWDFKAICCFAATGFFLDNDTYFTNQKVLRAATEYVDGEEQAYFKWHYSPRDISFSKVVDEFGHLFESISREQLEGKRIILPLSGGLDSRTQAAALKGWSDVQTYSYQFEHSFNETKYGAEISRRMGWGFREFIIPSGYLWNKVDDLYAINEGYAEFTNPRQMAIVEEYPDMGDVFYLGHWGDVLFDDMGVADNASFNEQLALLYKKIVKKGGMELAERLWRYWQLEGSFEDYFHERLSHLLDGIQIDNANARLRAFKSLYWAPRWTSINLAIFAKYHPLVLPYYDNRMCEWICTIPEKYLAGRQIQIEYIKRKAPELATIPWQSYEPCNLYNYKAYHKPRYQSKVLFSKILRRMDELLTGKVCTSRNWEIQYLGRENGRRLRDILFPGKGLAPREVCEEFYAHFLNSNHEGKVWYSHPLSILLVLAKKCE